MSKTVRDSTLESRSARSRLKPSPKPYWRALDTGVHVGYRKHQNGGGSWVARCYKGGGDYVTDVVGQADDIIDADHEIVLTYSDAQQKVRTLFLAIQREQAGLPVKAGPFTVRDAVNEYLAWMKTHRKSWRDAKYRAEALIFPRFGDVEARKLTTAMLQQWLTDLVATPPRARTAKDAEKQSYHKVDMSDAEVLRRRRSSANRTLALVKAAMNRLWKQGRLPTQDPWKRVEPFPQADAARQRFLTVSEVQRLTNGADEHFRPLLTAALHSGARYGELRSMTVSDFNPDSRTLRIGTSKGGRGRHIILGDEGAEFFATHTAGRDGSEPMFKNKHGKPWLPSHQHRPMREACKRAKISPPIGLHALRHSYASLAAMGGMPLSLLAKNLGHTSQRMVEKFYAHFADDYVSETIRATAPTFGLKGNKKVARIDGRRGK